MRWKSDSWRNEWNRDDSRSIQYDADTLHQSINRVRYETWYWKLLIYQRGSDYVSLKIELKWSRVSRIQCILRVWDTSKTHVSDLYWIHIIQKYVLTREAEKIYNELLQNFTNRQIFDKQHTKSMSHDKNWYSSGRNDRKYMIHDSSRQVIYFGININKFA